MTQRNSDLSFWGHLEVLRGTIIRSILVLLVSFIVLFFFKSLIFDGIVLAPAKPDFWLYKLLGVKMSVELVNIEVTAQFFTHIKVTFFAALSLAFPYLVFELWRFVVPALYENERVAMRGAFGLGGGLFYAGIAFGYFVVMPVMLYFFAGYQVSASIRNTFTLDSYISIFSSMVLLMGILFEFPTVIAVLSRLGIVSREFLRKYRRHSVIVILVLSAVLTPSGDPFTLLVVSVPLYVLYELSVLLCVKKTDD